MVPVMLCFTTNKIDEERRILILLCFNIHTKYQISQSSICSFPILLHCYDYTVIPGDVSKKFNKITKHIVQARPVLTQALDKQDFEELVDPRLEKNFVEHEMFRMIEAAAACVRHLAAKRPRMSQVQFFKYSA